MSDDAERPAPDSADRRTVALKRVRKFVATYVEKGKYELYPEAEVVENVVQGLADNLVAHGRMYCPCADVEESKTKGSDMVCPCKPHHADIARQGYCDCALFAGSDFVAAERVRRSAPAAQGRDTLAGVTHENGNGNGNGTALFRAGAAPRGGRLALFAPPPVDAIALEERAASLAKRSLKKGAKIAGLKLAISMMDLTTLEGKDTAGKVRQMCQKALRPLDSDGTIGPCGAVCVYPNFVTIAKEALRGSPVKVASVATAFPSGQSPLEIKLDDVRRAVEFGADEIDMVIDRGAMISGDYAKVFDEIAATKDACGPAHLKVILETGELGTYDLVRKASDLAIAAGGDFIKTSTGKIQPAATPPVTLLMLEAIRDHYYATGRRIGMKPAGGVRTAKQCLHYLVILKETLGDAWLTPDLFRFGASALLNDVLMQLEKERTGNYQASEDFSKD